MYRYTITKLCQEEFPKTQGAQKSHTAGHQPFVICDSTYLLPALSFCFKIRDLGVHYPLITSAKTQTSMSLAILQERRPLKYKGTHKRKLLMNLYDYAWLQNCKILQVFFSETREDLASIETIQLSLNIPNTHTVGTEFPLNKEWKQQIARYKCSVRTWTNVHRQKWGYL